MKTMIRRIITYALLLFVGISLAWTIIGGQQGKSAATPLVPDSASQSPEEKKPKYIAYYFHGNKRCDTCRTIEAYAAEAIYSAFPEELASGDLQWRVVNTDEPGNEHFVQDFDLTIKSVIIYNQTSQSYVDLFDVWKLVDEKDAFVSYVQTKTANFIGKSL